MASPKFTVAMPVRNGANYVVAALESLRGQTFDDFEFVASDNASTDSTPEILQSYCDRDRRFRWSRLDESLPVVENFNRAGSLAKGEWVVFLGHDDALEPECLERIAAAIDQAANPRLALVGFGESHVFANGFRVVPTQDRTVPPRVYSGPEFLRRKLSGRPPASLPAMSNAAVRREIWESHGRFDPRFLHCDTFLWHRVLLNHDYLVIAEPLVTIRIHDQQDSAVSVRKKFRSMNEFREFFPEFVRENSQALDLSPRARLLADRAYLSVAATEIVIQLLRRDPRRALQIMKLVPWTQYPLVAALLVRNGLRETARTRKVRQHVPARMVYPG